MLEGANGLSAAGCCSLLHAAVRDVHSVLVCKDQGDSADIALLYVDSYTASSWSDWCCTPW